MKCPDCEKVLKDKAIKCLCGWRKSNKVIPECMRPGCSNPGTHTGLCKPCFDRTYYNEHQERIARYKNGTNTT